MSSAADESTNDLGTAMGINRPAVAGIFAAALDRIAAWIARSRCLGGTVRTLYLRSSSELEIFKCHGRNVVSRGRISLSSLQMAEPGTLRSPALRGASRRGNRARLRLGSDNVITKSLSLPLAGEDVIGGIIGNQLELIAPWRREDIRFGYRVRQRDAANGQLHVDIAATSSEIIEAALGELARHGLTPRIVDFGTGAADRSPILIEVRDRPYRTNVRRALKIAARGAGVAALCSVLAGGWAAFGAYQRSVDVEREIAATRAALARSGELARRPDGLAAAEALLWKRRAERLPVTIAIEALSRAVPDDAWLEQIDINGDAITLVGVAGDVTKLVPAIEASPQFKDAAFASPSTRVQEGAGVTFVVTSQIRPSGELAP